MILPMTRLDDDVLCLTLSMPRTPKGHKRPADMIGNAVTVMKVATGEIDETSQAKGGKNKAAVELGRKGGQARASKMSKSKRVAIAKKAAKARWNRQK